MREHASDVRVRPFWERIAMSILQNKMLWITILYAVGGGWDATARLCIVLVMLEIPLLVWLIRRQ
jgi:hypothetical protein